MRRAQGLRGERLVDALLWGVLMAAASCAAAYLCAFLAFYHPAAWKHLAAETAASLAEGPGVVLALLPVLAAVLLALRIARRRREGFRSGTVRHGAGLAVAVAVPVAVALSILLAAGNASPGRAQARDIVPDGRAELAAQPERLKKLVAADQIVFGRGNGPGGLEAVCRCGPKLSVKAMPRRLKDALVAIEDRRFRAHKGIDPNGVVRAAWRTLASFGQSVEGGSTLTQQLVKNMVLTSQRNGSRKIAEAELALVLERAMSKDEILAAYLNGVVFAYRNGRPVVGVENAARLFFGRRARELNLLEAATLAGMLKAPAVYDPSAHPDRARERARAVLDAMVEDGSITRKDRKAALASSRQPGPRKPVFIETRSFMQWVTAQARRKLPGVSFDDATRIPITLDFAAQASAERTLRRRMARSAGLSSAETGFVAMDFGGKVAVMIGQRDYSARQVDFATRTKRQPASTMKPFTYAAAFEAGVLQPSPMFSQALAQSDNRMTVHAAETAGGARVAAFAHRMGIRSRLETAARSVALGASEVTLLELTTAYAPFANGGLAVEPYGYLGVVQGRQVLLWRGPETHRAIARTLAGTMRGMLEAVVAEKNGTGRPASRIPGTAGKTGTNGSANAKGNRDAWFIGMTQRRLAGLWLGAPDKGLMPGVAGRTAAKIWAEIEAARARR